MHKSSYDRMAILLAKYANHDAALQVIDVGSQVVGSTHPAGTSITGGTYRALCPTSWHYRGLDIAPGANVDLVAATPYRWPLKPGSIDLVISGQCLEHVPEPWSWMDEAFRVTKPNGLCIVIAPSGGPQHRYPVDCWRIMPDGMAYLLKRSGFDVLEAEFDYRKPEHWNDCWGVGRA